MLKLSPDREVPEHDVRAAEPRLWRKVNKDGRIAPGMTTPCWLWTGYTKNGYGSVSVRNYDVYVHRLAFYFHTGVWAGENVCHRCDVRLCVRGDHLFDGSQAANVADMRAKGRAVDPPLHLGEANPLATLSDSQVEELRRLAAEGRHTQRQLAALFGVSQSTVWRLKHGAVRPG